MGDKLQTEGADVAGDPQKPFTDSAVRVINRLMTARAYWKIPERVLESVPERLAAYIETLDPADSRVYDRAVRLFCRLIDQNIAQGKQEVQFLGQRGAEPPEITESAPAEQPALPVVEAPGLADAARTAQILADYGILQNIAKGGADADVIDGEATESE